MITIDHYGIEIELTPEQLGEALVSASAADLAKIVESLVERTEYSFGEQASDFRLRKVLEILRSKKLRAFTPTVTVNPYRPVSIADQQRAREALAEFSIMRRHLASLTKLSDEEMAELAQTCREWTAGAQIMTNGTPREKGANQ